YQGSKKLRLISCADIAKVVARVLTDPRPNNQLVHIVGESLSQQEILNTWKSLGQKVEEVPTTIADIDREVAKAGGTGSCLLQIGMPLARSVYFDGDMENIQADELTAEKLYPDLRFKTLKEYYRELISGTHN